MFAYDGIAVIVNPANDCSEQTSPEEQMADIYSGKITNWSEVGGDDADIFVVSREESSGTRSAFEELIGLRRCRRINRKQHPYVEGNGQCSGICSRE